MCLNNISDKWFSSLISIYLSPAFIGNEEILITRNREREAGQGSIKQENCISQSLSNTLQTSNPCSHSSCMKWFQSFLSYFWSINQRSLIRNGNIVIKRNRERERIRQVKNHSSRKIEFCNLSQTLLKPLFSEFSNFYIPPHPADQQMKEVWLKMEKNYYQEKQWKRGQAKKSIKDENCYLQSVSIKLHFASSLNHCKAIWL